jgi:predicted MFS family arabinose efflux permease
MSDVRPTALQEWKRHWPLVLTACIGFSFVSFMTAAAGVFMQPLGSEFGWSRSQLSLGIASAGLVSIICAPFLGVAIDRWGTRRLALPGVVLTGLAVISFSQASGSFFQWIVLWLIWGLCSLLILSTVWSAAVAGVFSAGRGLALGVTMGGTAVSQIVAPPLSNWLIEHFGWRGAFAWLGAGWGSVAFLLAFLFLYDAHDLRQRRKAAGGATATQAPALDGLSIAQAWRDPSLWRVALSTFLILTITIAVTVHQFPILVEAGASREKAAWLSSLAGFAGIVGKLVTGSLIDRFHARWIGGITLASTAVGYPLLMEGISTPALILVGIMISGYAGGTKIQLCGYLTARYAGMRNYGAIFGFMTSMIALSAFVGPVLAGLLHDHSGGYTAFLVIGVLVSLISGALVLSLGRYPEWKEAAV